MLPRVVPGYRIVRAEPAHVSQIAAVERAAAARFDPADVSEVHRRETSDPQELHAAREAGLLWVALDAADRVVGFAHVELLGDDAHLEELDVHPDHGRLGLGRALVEQVQRDAAERQLPGVTLTTFAHVPWNAPFYASAGFEPLAPDALSAPLRERRAHEDREGLAAAKRVVMRWAAR